MASCRSADGPHNFLMNFQQRKRRISMVRKTIAAAIALCAFAVTPAFVLAQDTTNQTQIFTTMTGPEKDYGMTLYNAIPVSEQPGFITYLTGFPPDQRVMIVRTLHMYSVAPNLTP